MTILPVVVHVQKTCEEGDYYQQLLLQGVYVWVSGLGMFLTVLSLRKIPFYGHNKILPWTQSPETFGFYSDLVCWPLLYGFLVVLCHPFVWIVASSKRRSNRT